MKRFTKGEKILMTRWGKTLEVVVKSCGPKVTTFENYSFSANTESETLQKIKK